MKACAAQIRVEDGIENKEKNASKVFEYVLKASERGCDLVVFPECLLGGFKDTNEVSEPLEGPFITRLKELSESHDIIIAGSFAESYKGRTFDTAFIIYKDFVGAYRKNILFTPGGEHKIFSPGLSKPRVFEIKGRKIGMLICYELRFPELTLPLLKEGVEILIIPAARMAPRRVSDREALIPARAVELQSYVIAVNRVGGKFFGRSAIAGPSGEVYRAGRNEGLYVAEIDKERIYETRSKIPAAETRKKLFEVLTNREALIRASRSPAVSSAGGI